MLVNWAVRSEKVPHHWSVQRANGLYERKRRKVFQGSRLVGGVAEAVALHPV